ASRGRAIRSARWCDAIGGPKCSEMGSRGRAIRSSRWRDGSRMLPESNQCQGAYVPGYRARALIEGAAARSTLGASA
ncbi:hypothetical protein PIB30_081883, partial [Stylosanthes scabra]|nr:hypothetical protein [Stylosanthes scabra]